MNNKILNNFNVLSALKKNKKKIGLCHGVFDIIHAGHIKYFTEAKKLCDVLIVSVTSDEYVNKSQFQPYNNLKKRLEVLNSISLIDYLIISRSHNAVGIIKKIKPNFYIKGKDYKNTKNDLNLIKEKIHVEKNNGDLIFTKSPLQSSSKIMNNKYLNWNSEQKKILQIITKYNLYDLFKIALEKINKLEITIIGEPIIDEYVFLNSVGVTSKDPTLSFLKINKKKIAGGVLAVAKMLSSFVKKINLITYGNSSYLKKNFKNFKNVNIININTKRSFQIKTRYLNKNRSEKINQISNFQTGILKNKENLRLKKKILKLKIKNLVICDYGIDLFNKDIINFIETKKINTSLNVQTNSLNFGLNLFTKYMQYNYLSLDQREWSLGLNKIQISKEEVNIFARKQKSKIFAFTDGKRGSTIFYNQKQFSSNVLNNSTVDTTGCGDAFFAISLLLIKSNFKINFIPLLSNIYAGLHANFIGNEKIIDKNEFLKYIKFLSSY